MEERTSVPAVASAQAPVRAGRRRSVVIGTALLGVVLAGTVAWWYARRPPAPEPPAVDLSDADPEVAQAVEEARAAVRKAPRSAKTWGRLGMILAVHDVHDAALVALAEAERLDPANPRWPYLQGKILQRDHPQEAIPKLRRAVELTDQTAAQIRLAQLPGDLGEQWFRLTGDQTAVRIRLAQLLLAQGHLDEAEAVFRRVDQADPTDGRAALGLGRVARVRGDLEGSVQHLQRATDFRGGRKTAHSLLAEIYAQLPNGQEKARNEREIAASLPEDRGWPDPYVEEAWLLRVGREARMDHAEELTKAGRRAAAIGLLHETAVLYPDFDRACLCLGLALFQDGNYPAAEQAFREAVRRGPSHAESHFQLGLTLYCLRAQRPGVLAEAADVFRQAAHLDPRNGRAHHGLGVCLEEQGDRGGAVASYRRALRCRPEYPEAHRQLGRLLIDLGRQAQAAAVVHCLLGGPDVIDLAACFRVEAQAHLRHAAQLKPHDRATQEALDRLAAEFPRVSKRGQDP